MRKKYITIILFLSVSTAFSQISIDSVLSQVERNNTALMAYRKKADADKIGNKTGLFPDNPEIEFNYLWGKPEMLGNRTDLAITQTFDFPSAYVYKSQLAKMKNQQVELEFAKQRYDILLTTKIACLELIYLNALFSEYQSRLKTDKEIVLALKKKLEVGDVTILDLNRAQVRLLNTEKQLDQIRIEREEVNRTLAQLNGGREINFNDSVFPSIPIEPDFEQWYAKASTNNPMLKWLAQEIAVSSKEEQLQLAQNLPKLNTGYMSEKVVGEQFQGITMGISVPLWGNRNTLKYAKLKSEAVNSMETDAKIQFYNEMKALHQKAIALHSSIADFKQRMADNHIRELLEKARDRGEISLTAYFYELMIYYDNQEELLRMEKELGITLAKLNKYNL